jgi:phosphoglycolate phosphatase
MTAQIPTQMPASVPTPSPANPATPGTAVPWARQDLDAALVDLDGTLVDTLDDFVEAVQRMLHDLPAPYCHHRTDRNALGLLVGKGAENLVRRLLAQIDAAQGARAAAMASEAVCAHALQRYLAHYRAINGSRARVYRGAREGLEQLRSLGLRLACVTNKPTAPAQDLLAHFGLDGFFSFVLGGDATERKKPDPLPLHTACARLGVSPQRSLMVGDSSNDAQAARAAGCPVLLVTYGYNHGEDILAVDADAFVHSLAGLRWRT